MRVCVCVYALLCRTISQCQPYCIARSRSHFMHMQKTWLSLLQKQLQVQEVALSLILLALSHFCSHHARCQLHCSSHHACSQTALLLSTRVLPTTLKLSSCSLPTTLQLLLLSLHAFLLLYCCAACSSISHSAGSAHQLSALSLFAQID